LATCKHFFQKNLNIFYPNYLKKWGGRWVHCHPQTDIRPICLQATCRGSKQIHLVSKIGGTVGDALREGSGGRFAAALTGDFIGVFL
jgi:hypothetical protein